MRFKKNNKGFSLVELLIVIGIIGILASIVLLALWMSRTKAYTSRSRAELSQIAKALQLYFLDHDNHYPADVNRGLPNGLENYLTSQPSWPKAAYPGGEYDWDYWDSDPTNLDAGDLSYPPEGKVAQISVRFCPIGDEDNCNFPKEKWAEDFDYYSSAYWCLEGPCRAHGSMPMDHPSCCMGGQCPDGSTRCN